VQTPCQSYANITSHEELQLQQEQDTHSTKKNLRFALLSPTPSYFHFLGYSLGFANFPVVFPFWGVLLSVFDMDLWLLPRRANKKCHELMLRARTHNASC